jgi:hypothetical protein
MDPTNSPNMISENYYADGTYKAFLRQCRDGSLAVSELLPRFAEHTLRGRLFVMDSDAITLAAAHTTKGALATVKLINGFFNPITSGKNAIILRARVATVSGTPAGGYFYNFLADSTINSASTGTTRTGKLDQPQTSVLTPQTNVILANAAGSTTALKQLAALGGPTAVAATGAVESIVDNVDGAIIVPPGYVFGLTATGAGTTHIVQSTLEWLELPV